jgi:hypothetical protein
MLLDLPHNDAEGINVGKNVGKIFDPYERDLRHNVKMALRLEPEVFSSCDRSQTPSCGESSESQGLSAGASHSPRKTWGRSLDTSRGLSRQPANRE